MDKVLYLMRGLPGSGKSTIAQMIANATNGVICSTDDFWMDEDEIYRFDLAKLGHAHKVNQRKVAEFMTDGQESIIVDNTNISVRDMMPYFVLASTFDYTVQIIPVMTPFTVCQERNALRNEDRRIPDDVIIKMNRDFQLDFQLDMVLDSIVNGKYGI